MPLGRESKSDKFTSQIEFIQCNTLRGSTRKTNQSMFEFLENFWENLKFQLLGSCSIGALLSGRSAILWTAEGRQSNRAKLEHPHIPKIIWTAPDIISRTDRRLVVRARCSDKRTSKLLVHVTHSGALIGASVSVHLSTNAHSKYQKLSDPLTGICCVILLFYGVTNRTPSDFPSLEESNFLVW